jgi:hypothetical protein
MGISLFFEIVVHVISIISRLFIQAQIILLKVTMKVDISILVMVFMNT